MTRRTPPTVGLAPLAEVPPGAITAVSRDAVRPGWLVCDGGLKDRDVYRRLFNVLGHAFSGGVDPGGNAFRLPNLVGRHVRGATSSANLTATGGSDTHSHDWTSAAGVPANSAANSSDLHGTLTNNISGGYPGGTLYTTSHLHGLGGTTPVSTGSGIVNMATGNDYATPGGNHTHGIANSAVYTYYADGHGHTPFSVLHDTSSHQHAVSLTQDVRSAGGGTALTGSSVPAHLPLVYVIKA